MLFTIPKVLSYFFCHLEGSLGAGQLEMGTVCCWDDGPFGEHHNPS